MESVIRDQQANYYETLATCGKAGNSTAFIEFLLKALRIALGEAAASAPPSGAAGTKSALSRHQVAILRQCRTETAIGALMAIAERSDRTKFRNQILKPLLEAGWVEMTLPDKPNSRLQKYRLTDQGQSMLES